MAVYFYQATDSGGNLVEGDVSAQDYQAALFKIRKLNYYPIRVSEDKPGKKFSIRDALPSVNFLAPIGSKDLMNLTLQLATLVNSGLTLDKSLSTLVKLMEKPGAREIISDIQQRVHAGNSFSSALSEYPRIFSKLYVNMVRAGEAGGRLGAVLERLAEFMEKADELKGNIQTAMIYPFFLVVVCVGAIVMIMTYVVPRLASIFDDMGEGLPFITQLVLACSAFLTHYWWALILAFTVFCVLFRIYIKTEQGRFQWDLLLLQLPLVGPLIRKIETSRFSRTMSTLQQSGVPVLQALFITQNILGNRVIMSAMDKLHDALKSGKGISEPLARLAVFPPLAIHMITVGEESGTMNDMLAKISKIYDKEVERSIKQMLSLLEPTMILFMALIIGFIVFGMLLGVNSISTMSL